MGWVWGGCSYPLFPEKEEFFHFEVARFGAFRASWCGDCVDVTATLFPRLLLLLLSISIFPFEFFCFTLFSCCLRAAD